MLTERAFREFQAVCRNQHCLRHGRVWRYYAQGENLNKRTLKKTAG